MGRSAGALLLVILAGAAVADPVPEPPSVRIPAGAFIAGSDRAEREQAYRLDEQAYGH